MNYYVYIYLNKLKPGKYKYKDISFEFEPFYIGKGKGKRYMHHLNKVKNKCKYKKNSKFDIIEDNIKNGVYPEIIKIDNLSEEYSLFLEKEMITKIGRMDINTGPLTNRNDGGIKPQDNYHHTKEVKNKISISGRKRSPDDRYTLISPDNNIFRKVKLLNFCEENKLDYQKMRKYSNKGKIPPIRITSIKQSKTETINCVGWTVINNKIKSNKEKYIKYKLIDPSGNETIILRGEIIKDLCEKLNLDHRTLRYYKNKGRIKIKNKNQCGIKSANCDGWEFIDHLLQHQ